MTDQLTRGLAAHGAVRVLIADVTGVTHRTRRSHDLDDSASMLAAQALAATALMSAHIKGEERLTIQIQAEAPRFSYIGDVTADGAMRARLQPSRVPKSEGALRGILLAIKSKGHRETYRGSTEISAETLEEAFRHHLGNSSQVDAVLRLVADNERTLGLLVERLPAHPEHPSLDPEAFARQYAHLDSLDARTLIEGALAGQLDSEPFSVIDQRPLRWECTCSFERVSSMLRTLGVDTLREMLAEDRGASVNCNFCNDAYQFDEGQLAALITSLLPVGDA